MFIFIYFLEESGYKKLDLTEKISKLMSSKIGVFGTIPGMTGSLGTQTLEDILRIVLEVCRIHSFPIFGPKNWSLSASNASQVHSGKMLI